MSSADYKHTILTEMSTCLKPRGFRKQQSLFVAKHDETVQLIQLQSSLKSTKDQMVVTVNLGIFSSRVAERIGNTHKPNIPEAHWRERIGRFIDGSDKWWQIQSQAEAHQCGVEITHVLANEVLATMRSLTTTEGLIALWERGMSPGLTDKIRKQYLQVLRSTSSPR